MPTVSVDHGKCIGDAVCVGVCANQVFEVKELQGYEGKKSVVVHMDACNACRACETQCTMQCITITD